MARRWRKYGSKDDDRRQTLAEAMLSYRSMNKYGLFSLLYVSGFTSSDSYRIAFGCFDDNPQKVACNASRTLRHHEVQFFLRNVAYAYRSDDIRLRVDFPLNKVQLDWEDLQSVAPDVDEGLHPKKSK